MTGSFAKASIINLNLMENCNILVPLDFSDAGTYALQAAQKLARLFNGSITPFHSYIPVSDFYNGPDMMGMEASPAPMQDPQQMEEMHRNHMQKFTEGKVPDSLLNKPLISIGNPAQAIAEEAEAFDLIVMSSHGRSGFSRLFLGSVSDKVLRTASVPVLTVNKEKQLKSLDRIMLATDFSDHSKESFPIARQIAKKAQAQIELVHILSFDPDERDKPEDSAISRRKKRLEILIKEEFSEIEHLIEKKLIISSNTPHEALLNENLNNPHDLVIMSTVGRTGIDYLMMGSTTSNVVRHVKSPVLSINPKNKRSNREEE
jgi:nucleotide-binding universal stress UspA family protein